MLSGVQHCEELFACTVAVYLNLNFLYQESLKIGCHLEQYIVLCGNQSIYKAEDAIWLCDCPHHFVQQKMSSH